MKVLVFLVVLFGLVACNGDKSSETELDSGEIGKMRSDTAMAKGDSRLDELNDLIVSDPGNSNHYHERAYVYFHRGELENALRDVKKAIEMNPDIAGYYFSKGYFFHAALQLEEAKTAFEQCLERDENFKDAHLYLAKIYLALASRKDKYGTNYDLAREELNKVLKIDQYYAEAYFLRGVIYEELGDSGSALSAFKTATDQDADYYDAYIRMGLLYAAKLNPKAEFAYKTALDLKPGSTEALFALAKYYQDAGKYDDAEEAYLKVVEIDSMYSLAYLNLGYMYMTYDTAYDKALEYLHRAVFFNPGVYLPMTYTNIGQAFELKGNYTKARKYYKEALKVDENHLNAAYALDYLDRRGL